MCLEKMSLFMIFKVWLKKKIVKWWFLFVSFVKLFWFIYYWFYWLIEFLIMVNNYENYKKKCEFKFVDLIILFCKVCVIVFMIMKNYFL